MPPRRVRLLRPDRRQAAAYSNAVTKLLPVSTVFLPSSTAAASRATAPIQAAAKRVPIIAYEAYAMQRVLQQLQLT